MQTKISIVVLLTLFTLGTSAQQLFKITQYTQHNFLYNPAAAGANDKASVGFTYRSMWSGMPGGPKTAFIYGDKYFAKKKTGIALAAYTDKTGPTSRTGGIVDLSYSIDFENGKRLMFGLGGELMQYKIDKAEIADAIPGDPLLSGSGTSFVGDANTGIYYKSPTLNIGASAMQIIQTNLNLVKDTKGENNVGKLYRHYFFTANYNIQVDEDNVLIPNVLVKYLPNAPTEYEAGLRLEYQQLLYVGFNYHYKQDLSGYFGVFVDKQCSIGYSFDRYNKPLDLFDGGNLAHEISIRYFFSK